MNEEILGEESTNLRFEALLTVPWASSWWWGGIRFPWLPLAEDGSVLDDAQKLCDVLDVVGIIDLTRSDPRQPAPAGFEPLDLTVVTGDHRPPWGLPVRAVASSAPDAPLMVAGEVDGGKFDPVALLGLGDLDEGERAGWEQAGQPISAAKEPSVLSQMERRTAVGVTATAVDDFISTSAFMTSAALVWVLPDTFTLGEVGRDLAGFWNYRALRLRHRGTVTVLSRLSSLRDEETGRRLVEEVSATALSTPMCVFNGLAVNDGEMRGAAEALGFRVITGNTEWTERHYQRDEPLELTAVTGHRLAGWWLVIAWAATQNGRRVRLRCIGTTKNDAWLHTRCAAINLRTLLKAGLTRRDGAWMLA